MKRIRGWMFLLAVVPAVAADVPGWAKELATQAVPKYPPQTTAVVLWDEEKNTLEESGRRVLTVRRAIRVLTPDGRKRAVGSMTWEGSKSKVTDAHAWILQPSGKNREMARKEMSEGQATSFELYDTTKYLLMDASREVDAGGVFVYEIVLESRSVFSQFTFSFQNDLPHLLSRLQVTVPAGWTAVAKGYQGAKAEAMVSGSTYTWEERNLPPVEREPGSPRLSSLVPRVAVSVLPPEGQAAGVLPAFRSWQDVSVWKTKLVDPQVVVNAAVEEKARALTAGQATVMDKARALGEFAQKIRYVAVSINTSMGGGYVPRKSDEVLAKAYGDCKDKANLLRALLKTQGVESYPVSIFSGDPRYTREDWPSPHQFNHAILAIRTGEDWKLPASFVHPAMGPMLLFDPTDPHVAFGYLPDHEQGAKALLMAGEKGTLFATPETRPEQNQTQRTWKMKLTAEGKLSGEMEEVSTGQDAFDRLEQEQSLAGEKWKQAMGAWLGQAVAGVDVKEVKGTYDAKAKTYLLKMTFEAASYARVLQGKLWTVRSVPAEFRGLPNVNRTKRELPLVLPSLSFAERVEWNMPETLKMDELPGGDEVKAKFGTYSSRWKAEGQKVMMERQVEVKPGVVEAEGYAAARDFVGRFHGAGGAPIVMLAR